MSPLDIALDALLFAVPLIHLLVSPYTKVEESFSLQATHDLLVYGTPVTDRPAARLARTYDHFTFPGVVPRSFVGPVLLAGIAQPVIALVGFHYSQLIVRAVLATANGIALLLFRNALGRAYGTGPARWWLVLTVTQFHIAYYLSRTLPNIFAFGLTTVAMACLLPRVDARKAMIGCKQAIGLLVFATVIFRAELAILLGAVGLQLLVARHLALRRLLMVGLGFFSIALIITVLLDSYFWQKPVWPELWGFYFNAVLGSSSNWGVSSWHYYFTSALPRLLLNPLALPLGCYALAQPGTRSQAMALCGASLLYVAIYSLQPHKEVRFIFYAVPSLTATAALGAHYVATRRRRSVAHGLAFGVLVLSVLATAAASSGMLLVSSLNYPGGDALTQLYHIVDGSGDAAPTISVHADVLTCMTGLTLFGQNRDGLPLALRTPEASGAAVANATPMLVFDKTEDRQLLKRPSFWEAMDYALVEDRSAALGGWQVLGVVQGYDGIEMLRPCAPAAGDTHSRRRVIGMGARVARLRDAVRQYTGGWWIGPRMAPRIYIMRRVQHGRLATA